MTARRVVNLIAAAALATAAYSCGISKPARFYTLDSTAAPIGAALANASVMVGPVTVPASVDRPEIVVRVAPNRVDVDEFNRWAAALDDSIARAVAGDLAAQLGSPDVTTAPLANFNPDYRVIIDVQRFESTPGKSALTEAMWTVRSAATGDVRSGRTVAQETPQGDSYQALAAAHSQALAIVSADIAAAIRSEARDKH
ncbi:MAG: PqiC family protein [Candidatus Binataceae bacterium]